MGMQDTPTAANLLRVMRKIAKKVVDKERPDMRTGRVFSINTDTQIAQVLFPGNTVDSLVPASFGMDKIPTTMMETTFSADGYAAAGDVVRVAGKPSAWFILDFVKGIPASVFVTESAVDNFYQDSTVVTATGTQTITLTNLPIANSEHFYWNSTFQPESQWTRVGKVITILDPSLLIQVGDFLECKYAYIQGDQTPPPPTPDPTPVPASLEFIGSRVINNFTTGITQPDGTLEGDLLIVSVSCGGFTSIEPIVSDARLPNIYQPPQGGHTRKVIAWGYATGSTADLAVHVEDPEGNGKVVVAAYRVTGSVSSSTSHGESVTFAPTMPSVPTNYGILAIVYADSGVDFSRNPYGAWSRDVLAYSTNQRQMVWEAAGTPAVTFSDYANVEWIAVAIGLSDA
jgi:hypothetical protein